MIYGLLGRRLGHSHSPAIHRMLGNPSYELFEREEDELAALFAREDIGGLNITIPYKKTVLPFLTEMTDKARRIGCVNTVVFHADGSRTGDNTDYDGFAGTLDGLDYPVDGKRALLLGTGATSQTVRTVLVDRGAKEVRRLGREELPPDADARHFDLLINCTPVGMYPNNGESLVDLSGFTRLSAVIDLIYNPHRSHLLLQAKKRGIPYADGLPMLVRQAMAASEQFIGKSCAKEEDILRRLRRQTDSIVLIGMPGCGKTTVGKTLAESLPKTFVDIDEEIEKTAGKTIPQIFQEEGEAGFRGREKTAIQAAGKEPNRILATGGGAVKDPANYDALAQNGRIYYLQRELEALPVQGRPLSAGGLATLQTLFQERDPLYRAFADKCIPPGTIEEQAAWIKEDFYANCHY